MHYKRVIPCLDVDAGRVVKGTNFVDLRDAGDPVELAERYDAEGADELVFLDITATHDKRDTIVELARRDRRQRLHPVHDRRRHPLGRGRPGGARRRRRQGLGQLRRGRAAGADRRAGRGLRRAVRRAGDRRARPRGRRAAGRSSSPAGARRPGRDAVEWAREGVRARGGGDPAHEHGPRRHQGRLRPRAHARPSPSAVERAGDRLRRRRRARAPRRRARTPAPTPCCARRSSTTGATASARPRRRLADAGVPVRPIG